MPFYKRSASTRPLVHISQCIETFREKVHDACTHFTFSNSVQAPKGKFCKNHSYCVKYSDLDCASEWVQLNCPRMCRLCEYEGDVISKLMVVNASKTL